MYNNTSYYKKLIAAWQTSDDRREAHSKACGAVGDIEYSTFMNQIRYLKNQKNIDLKSLALPVTDWDSLREFATTTK